MCSILYSSAARFAARTKHLNVWHEHGRSNVLLFILVDNNAHECLHYFHHGMHSLGTGEHPCDHQTILKSPSHTDYTAPCHCPATLLYPSKVPPPIVVKLAFSLRRHIRRTLAIIQSKSTTHGTSLTIAVLMLPALNKINKQSLMTQSITFEASDRSRSLPLALIHILASELSLAPIREIAR